MENIIIAAVPVHGHVEPMRAIARHLVTRGHRVTFLTGSIFKDAVECTGARFAPLQGKADLTSERLAKVLAEQAALPDPVAAMEHGLRTTIVDAVPAQFAALQQLLASAEGGDVVLIHEVLFGGAWPLQLGAPGLRPRAVIGRRPASPQPRRTTGAGWRVRRKARGGSARGVGRRWHRSQDANTR